MCRVYSPANAQSTAFAPSYLVSTSRLIPTRQFPAPIDADAAEVPRQSRWENLAIGICTGPFAGLCDL